MSLPRTPEPESMSPSDEAAEYLAMDHREVNVRFVDDLLAGGPVGPRVIDLGCGPVQIPIELCRRSLEFEVMGIDASVEMLELAKREIDLAGLIGRVFLEQSDAERLEAFEESMADTVMSNSLLHHLDEPPLALRGAVRLLRPGGRLFIRDLARPASAEAVESLVATHAKDATPPARQLLRQSLHAAWKVEEVRRWLDAEGIPHERVEMTSDRHWTLDWTKPINA